MRRREAAPYIALAIQGAIYLCLIICSVRYKGSYVPSIVVAVLLPTVIVLCDRYEKSIIAPSHWPIIEQEVDLMLAEFALAQGEVRHIDIWFALEDVNTRHYYGSRKSLRQLNDWYDARRGRQ